MKTVVWFRQDLRLSDNPALAYAAERGGVIPVYILDDGGRPLGGASRWWLHKNLAALKNDLPGLILMRGDPLVILNKLVEQTGADAVCWNRCYEPHAIARDKTIKAAMRERGLEVESFNGALLVEPWEVKTGQGGPFKVYSPFWRAAKARDVASPVAVPKLDIDAPAGIGDDLDDWNLLPSSPNWADGWEDIWQPGEAGAQARLESFLDDGLAGYGTLRNRPDKANVSRLSPHLHWGAISPRQIWARAQFLGDRDPARRTDIDKFLSEIGWREFSYHLLYHFPSLPEENWRPAFDAYPWRDDSAGLQAWRKGRTGYPLVDAGLRELWQTGYMHNRVRMVTASFLVKHLRLHWSHGEAWFWDTLVDADQANNAASWQWVAGCGADAAPYFRIFNPMTQGEKFDPDGAYVRRWCPELAGLDNKVIHAPFKATEEALHAAGVVLGDTYPRPIVDHAAARAAALAGYEAVKAANTYNDGTV